MPICDLCGLDCATSQAHHLIPRTRHSNKKNKKDFDRDRVKETVALCQPCHSKIHSLFDEKELERDYNTLDRLQATDAVQAWLAWRRKHPRVQRLSSKKKR